MVKILKANTASIMEVDPLQILLYVEIGSELQVTKTGVKFDIYKDKSIKMSFTIPNSSFIYIGKYLCILLKKSGIIITIVGVNRSTNILEFSSLRGGINEIYGTCDKIKYNCTWEGRKKYPCITFKYIKDKLKSNVVFTIPIFEEECKLSLPYDNKEYYNIKSICSSTQKIELGVCGYTSIINFM